MIEIVTGDSRPIFRQIVDGLRRQIAGGELPPGSRLPSVRGLAQQLRISLNTVAKAYAVLTNEGLIESRDRVGVFVCEPRQILSLEERQRRLEEAVSQFVNSTYSLGFDDDELIRQVEAGLEQYAAGHPNSGDPE